MRVNPDEISIRDPSYFSKLYVSSLVRHTDLPPRFRHNAGLDGKSEQDVTTTSLITHVLRSSVKEAAGHLDWSSGL